MKFSSYLKALTVTPQKAITRLSHWENFEEMSPKDQGDLSGLIVPKTGSKNYNQVNNVDIDYLERLYRCHDLVHSSINLVSSTFGLGDLRVKVRKNEKYIYDNSHKLQKLLDNPNSTMTGFDLKQAYIEHRLLFGAANLLLLRDDMKKINNKSNDCPECQIDPKGECLHLLWRCSKGPITQIIPIHPHTLKKKTYNINGVDQEYHIYTPSKNNETPIHPNNIIIDPIYNALTGS